VIYYLPSRFEFTQAGFVVSKKVSKSAVLRNRLRRRVSAIIEENYHQLTPPMQIIILIRKDFSTIPVLDLKNEIIKLIGAIKQ
jgi:ribonuclease P protein component